MSKEAKPNLTEITEAASRKRREERNRAFRTSTENLQTGIEKTEQLIMPLIGRISIQPYTVAAMIFYALPRDTLLVLSSDYGAGQDGMQADSDIFALMPGGSWSNAESHIHYLLSAVDEYVRDALSNITDMASSLNNMLNDAIKGKDSIKDEDQYMTEAIQNASARLNWCKNIKGEWSSQIRELKRNSKPLRTQARVGRGILDEASLSTDEMLHCRIEKMGANRKYLGATNGAIDLHTGHLLNDIDEVRKLFLIESLPDPYNPDARNIIAMKLFAHLDSSIRDYVLAELGYSLRGFPSRRFLLLLGATGGGKSTLLNAVKTSLGVFGKAANEDAFTRKRGNASALSPSIVALMKPTRIAIKEEADEVVFNTERLKGLTGDSTYNARDLYQKEVDTRSELVTATLLLSANKLPNFDMSDDALSVRLRVLPYPAISEEAKHPGMTSVFFEYESARQCLVAMMVKAAAETCGDELKPPEPPEEVIEFTRASIEELRGEAIAYLETYLDVNARGYKLTQSEIWQRLCDVCEVSKDGKVVGGASRRKVNAYVKQKMSGQPAINMWHGNKTVRGWVNLRWKEGAPEGDNEDQLL